ncbi:hypothetical protein [Amycolatopsis tolypomycina]|uniref:N-acetyltransferase domain-containing protein n=1 Tax=Amycolatopsis tolypomycina TaxID=208445 RepID=A0A1H4TPX9_9PSEU|nr:hypothetical protein [Amycolatopsis tolypomycina]SEC58151.1 hypothetical protein SAMN04489727_4282 [Amycolatopsis tolypomycina]
MTSIAPVAPPADPAERALPRWSARAGTAADRAAVLALFTDPGFFFRTDRPDTRSEQEIDQLLGDDTRVLHADGEPVGLYALEHEGSEHGCHYVLHLRLRSDVPLHWWHDAYREIVHALRWRHELVRLSVRFPEFDPAGLAFARSAGLTEEGTLAGVTTHEGRRRGTVFFSQVWAES